MKTPHSTVDTTMVPVRVLIVLTVLAGVFSVTQTVQGQDASLYEQALESFENGNLEVTESLIEAFTQTDSLTTDWVLLQAKLFAKREQFEPAVRHFLSVLEMTNGQHIEAKTWLENAGYDNAEALKNELPALQRLVADTPENVAIRIRLADALAADGQFSSSIKAYQELLAENHASPGMVKSMLIAISSSGSNHRLGEQIAEEYIALYPEQDDLWMRLGYFQMWRGKYIDAQASFEKVLEINPTSEDATAGIANVKKFIEAERAKMDLTASQIKKVEEDPLNVQNRLALTDNLLVNGLIYDASKHLDFLSSTFDGDDAVMAEVNARRTRISDTTPGRAGSTLDRVYLQLLKNPNDPESRFSFVELLINRARFYDAYDELNLIPESLQSSEQWRALFEKADAGLIKSHGESPVFQIDRLSHLLRLDPDNVQIRYALVDSLAASDRYTEALKVLTLIPGIQQEDMLENFEYQEKLNSIASDRIRYSEERAASIPSELIEATGARTIELKKEFIDHLVLLGEESLAQSEFEQLIALQPDDIRLQLDWVNFLIATEQFDRATSVSETLFELYGGDPDVQKSVVLSGLRKGLDESATRLMDRLVTDSTVTDTGFLLEVANYYVDTGDVGLAEQLLVRVDSLEGAISPRFSSVKALLEREKARIVESDFFAELYRARELAFGQQYPEAARQFQAYFDTRKMELRSEVAELARTYAADSLFDAALETFEKLQDEAFSYELEKEIARIKSYAQDFRGALQIADSLISINPRDYESQLYQASALQELGVFEEAGRVVDDARASMQGSEFLDARLSGIESDIRTQLIKRGQWTAHDFAGIIIPTAFSVHAEGGGTSYDRRTQGLRAEVTLPVGSVITAGFNSHFISGSRRLVPDAEFVRTNINQLYGSVFLDLTPPIQSEIAPYTNRVFVEAGLYDYDGSRSVGYFNFRYWKQVKGKYLGMIGLRTDEGTIDLWSPGGGEFNLRLMQLDISSEYVGAVPDSLIRLAGRLAVNVVSDNLGLLSGTGDRNVGSDLMLEAGYKVIDHTYAGIAYHQLNYESRTDTYFSPEHWELTELFLEHEREAFSRWYVRFRGSIGAISRSSGQMAQRLEADVIKRIGDNLSITLQSTLGETSRALGGGVSSLFNRYNTLHLTGSVRWTL